MKGYAIFRLVCLALLWVALCVIMLSRSQLTVRTVFVVVCSGIVVFVPIYKKYVRARPKD